MKYGLAYYRPDDDGGEDVEEVSAENQKDDLKIPEDLSGFLKSRGLDPKDPKSLLTVWESRGVEVKNAKDYRRRAQEAEAKSHSNQKMKLAEMVSRLEDDDRAAIEDLLRSTEGHAASDESLAMIAEAGISMTPEILDLVKAGPAATKAYLSAIKTRGAAETKTDGDSLEGMIEKAIRRVTGVGADQTQRDQKNGSEKKKSILAELQGPRTRTHEILDSLKAGAEKNLSKE